MTKEQAAADLELPKASDVTKGSMSTSQVWRNAFDWYNQYVNTGRPLRLQCRPCYAKVYMALREAKND